MSENLNTHKVTFAALAIAMAVAVAVAVAPTFITSASAAIREGCENQGGNEPTGQQGKCQGGGLDEFAENPAGQRPPGQQP
jgi:hypothetical protein